MTRYRRGDTVEVQMGPNAPWSRVWVMWATTNMVHVHFPGSGAHGATVARKKVRPSDTRLHGKPPKHDGPRR